MKNPELVARLLELQTYWYFSIVFVTIAFTIITIYYLYKIKQNSDYILKLRIYEFKKNNPEKDIDSILNDRFKHYKMKAK